MDTYPVADDLESKSIPLKNIYLDPNNPRFIGADWLLILDEEFDQEVIQEEAERTLVRDFAIGKLRANMEVNGYLPIDQVVIREFKKDRYLVLEGNRRICAAKLVVENPPEEMTDDVLATFLNIPCLIYTGEDKNAAWLFQGLRHITSVMPWSSFSKAKLLAEQMEEQDLALSEVGRRFGLSAHGSGQWVRGYRAFLQAREKTDYTEELEERAYAYFQEIFSRSSIPVREWLEWDDSQREFRNELHLNEFASWLYPKTESDEGETDSLGEFEKRVLRKVFDVRTVSTLIRDAPDIFQQFRNSRDLEGSYSQALARKFEKKAKEKANPVEEVFEAIAACNKALENLPFKMLSSDEIRPRLLNVLNDMQASIDSIRENAG